LPCAKIEEVPAKRAIENNAAVKSFDFIIMCF
jgi:hypothetical protein